MPERTIHLRPDSGVTKIEVPGATILLTVHDGWTDARYVTHTKLEVITADTGTFGPLTVDPKWGISANLYPNPELDAK